MVFINVSRMDLGVFFLIHVFVYCVWIGVCVYMCLGSHLLVYRFVIVCVCLAVCGFACVCGCLCLSVCLGEGVYV